ncbi:MAG: OmpH family outer membrane protein [Paludibacteraceae bacterium]|nr:OmpH family outer membrane protein [Paludibacteraceae bacterium]
MDNKLSIISLVCNAILTVAVIVLFVLYASNKPAEVEETTSVVPLGEQIPVAYINLDSLLTGYAFAVEANDQLMAKQENARVELNSAMRKLQGEMNDFQRKIDNNAFLSRERAESEQRRILKKQQDLEARNDQLTQSLLEEQQRLTMQLKDTIDVFLAEYNKDGRYQIILSNSASDNVLYSTPGHDITKEVIDQLNKRMKH